MLRPAAAANFCPNLPQTAKYNGSRTSTISQSAPPKLFCFAPRSLTATVHNKIYAILSHVPQLLAYCANIIHFTEMAKLFRGYVPIRIRGSVFIFPRKHKDV
jgi:hypothetical protein